MQSSKETTSQFQPGDVIMNLRENGRPGSAIRLVIAITKGNVLLEKIDGERYEISETDLIRYWRKTNWRVSETAGRTF